MTQREQKLAIGAGGAGAVLACVLAYFMLFVQPLKKAEEKIGELQNDLVAREIVLKKRLEDKKELIRLRGISLPADPNPLHREYDLAWGEYDKYLRDLMRVNGLKSVRITPIPPTLLQGPANARNKKPLYQPLTYTVDATGPATSLVAMLEQFYKDPLLHQIKAVTIRPAKVEAGARASVAGPRAPLGGRPARDLDIRLMVEALIVDGAEKRPHLMPWDRRMVAVNGLAALQRGPTGLPLAAFAGYWTGIIQGRPLIQAATPGSYATISRKNIFYAAPAPPPPKDPATKRKPPTIEGNKYIFLTRIIHRSDGKVLASLYDQLKGGKSIKLDPADDNYTSIPVCKDTEDDRLIRGEVVHFGRSEVVFRLRLVSRKERGENNGEKIICLDEAKRLYRMRKTYWEALEEEETLTSTSGTGEGSNFVFRGKTIGGTVVGEDDRYVDIEIYPKYFDRLYAVRVGESLDAALQDWLTPRQIKELGIPEPEKTAKKEVDP